MYVYEAQQQVLTIQTQDSESFLVKCRMDDDVWKGLFYEQPFLNKYVASKADCDPVCFNGDFIAGYIENKYANPEKNKLWEERYYDRIRKLIKEQAVRVLQVKMFDKSKLAMVEVVWSAPHA